MIEIPLTSEAEQVFTTTLDELVYSFRIIYNTRKGSWSFDLTLDGVELLSGISIVGGVDLLSAYNLELKNLYAVNTATPRFDATDTNLGTDVKLLLLTDEEVAGEPAI